MNMPTRRKVFKPLIFRGLCDLEVKSVEMNGL